MVDFSSIDDLGQHADDRHINFSIIDFCIVSSESIGASSPIFFEYFLSDIHSRKNRKSV